MQQLQQTLQLKSLTVSGITAADKTYDGNAVATINGRISLYSGLIQWRYIYRNLYRSFNNANVGTGKTVTITLQELSNYSVTDQSSTTADISAKGTNCDSIYS